MNVRWLLERLQLRIGFLQLTDWLQQLNLDSCYVVLLSEQVVCSSPNAIPAYNNGTRTPRAVAED